jgi:hypothetical protein
VFGNRAEVFLVAWDPTSNLRQSIAEANLASVNKATHARAQMLHPCLNFEKKLLLGKARAAASYAGISASRNRRSNSPNMHAPELPMPMAMKVNTIPYLPTMNPAAAIPKGTTPVATMSRTAFTRPR